MCLRHSRGNSKRDNAHASNVMVSLYSNIQTRVAHAYSSKRCVSSRTPKTHPSPAKTNEKKNCKQSLIIAISCSKTAHDAGGRDTQIASASAAHTQRDADKQTNGTPAPF